MAFCVRPASTRQALRVAPNDMYAYVTDTSRAVKSLAACFRYCPAMELRHQLRELRESAGLKQAELARQLGVNQSTVSFIENGRHAPSMDLLDKWLAACGATLRVERPGADPLAPLVDAARGLGAADLALLRRVALTIPMAPDLVRRQLEAIAAAVPPSDGERTWRQVEQLAATGTTGAPASAGEEIARAVIDPRLAGKP